MESEYYLTTSRAVHQLLWLQASAHYGVLPTTLVPSTATRWWAVLLLAMSLLHLQWTVLGTLPFVTPTRGAPGKGMTTSVSVILVTMATEGDVHVSRQSLDTMYSNGYLGGNCQ